MNSILIIRPSAIGDIIMASPIIRVLREAYPQAHIAWLIEPSAEDLLCHNQGLSELICWPKNRWKRLLRERRVLLLKDEVTKFTRQLRVREFDLALDIQGLFRSRLLARLSGARERIGFESKEPGRFLMTRISSRGPHSGIMGSEYHYMMETIGLSPGDFHPEITLSPDDEKTGDSMVEALNIGDRYAVFAPFTTRPQKHWFKERWAILAGLIRKYLDLPVILLGGKDDLKQAELIEMMADKNLINFTGKTSLGQGAAIIKKASLLVGVDTGLTHMGAAFDCPTIALFGATCPYLNTAGHKTFVIYNEKPCSPCRRSPVCNGDYACMKSIETKQVLDAAIKMFEA